MSILSTLWKLFVVKPKVVRTLATQHEEVTNSEPESELELEAPLSPKAVRRQEEKRRRRAEKEARRRTVAGAPRSPRQRRSSEGAARSHRPRGQATRW